MMRFLRAALALTTAACACSASLAGDIGAQRDRAALFDWLVEKTHQREAYSAIKYERLGVDVAQAMQACRQEVLDAEDEVRLYYALAKLSAARRDRHLSVFPIDGGLDIDRAFQRVAERAGHASVRGLAAPVIFKAGFADPDRPEIFVADVGRDAASSPYTNGISIADRLVSINGQPVAAYAAAAKAYWRHSTPTNFWSRFALDLNQVSRALPPWFYAEKLSAELVNEAGEEYQVELPYFREQDIRWQGAAARRYPGFALKEDYVSFDIYEPTDGQPVLLLQWYGFREDLVESIDKLMQLATQEGWLDYDLVIDCTVSRGGSRGAYAIQHLSPKAFRTTYGNLRLSDAAVDFCTGVLHDRRRGRRKLDGGIPEAVGNADWLVDWITSDVLPAYVAGQDYSNNVPFKCAHLPRTSFGVMSPAATHFRGRMICWFSPHGGSHLDQFAAMVGDNDLAYSIGMPTGGYSNTWEWEEEVCFPTTGAPAIGYMWSIGHTIRPNGQVLEGNPAEVDQWYPVTRENYSTYYTDLTRISLERLAKQRRTATSNEPSRNAR